MRTNRILVLSSAIVAGLILTGCSAGDATDQSTSSGAGMQNEAAAPADAAVGTAKDDAGAADSPAKAPDPSVDQRSIIDRGSLSVRVKDVNAAAGQVSGIATGAGGFVGADNRSSGAGSATATMELRVPADKFAA